LAYRHYSEQKAYPGGPAFGMHRESASTYEGACAFKSCTALGEDKMGRIRWQAAL